MIYIENKYLPPAYLLRLYQSMLKDHLGNEMSLTNNQKKFLTHLLSYPIESIDQEKECMNVIEAIFNQQKAQQILDCTL
ncbi:hypothetical protein [Dysgonomonas capnocytophagoides]|uniref:hypothetical protein n=1 Tax=Dysgonomonas capnocytophagoides TaxID=45254 RepID=UPI0030C85603